MAKGINKVILIGNLGKDPETRYLPSGGAVTNITIATSESWTDKQTSQKQERTEWHRVVFFNRLAEIAGEYLKKGSKVYVEGALRTRKWQDPQSGQDRYSTEIVGNDLQMLDNRAGSVGISGADDYSSYEQLSPQTHADTAPATATASRGPAGKPLANTPSTAQPNSSFDDSFDDDIPF